MGQPDSLSERSAAPPPSPGEHGEEGPAGTRQLPRRKDRGDSDFKGMQRDKGPPRSRRWVPQPGPGSGAQRAGGGPAPSEVGGVESWRSLTVMSHQVKTSQQLGGGIIYYRTDGVLGARRVMLRWAHSGLIILIGQDGLDPAALSENASNPSACLFTPAFIILPPTLKYLRRLSHLEAQRLASVQSYITRSRRRPGCCVSVFR